MSVDYTRTTGVETPEESESSMFAPAPIWDRRKGKGSGRAFFEQNADRDTSMDREIHTDTGSTALGAAAGMAGGAAMADEATRETAMSPSGDDAPYMATTRDRTVVRRDRSMAPAAVGVGLVALAALAAAGWYATRPADKTLTPGGATSTTIATTSGSTTTMPTQMAANTPSADAAAAAAATPHVASTTSHHTVTTSTRAATPMTTRSRSTTVAISPERSVRAPSAATSGVNTGANAPVNNPPLNSVGVVPSAPATATPPPAATAPPVNSTPTPAPTTAPTPAPSTTTPDVTPPASTATAPAPTPPQ